MSERMDSMRDRWTDRLSEYLDGELGWDEQNRLELHLEECEECSAILADLRRVVARADGLDDQPPARELWPGIVTRIDVEGAQSPDVVDIRGRVGVRTDVRPWKRRLTVSIPQLAAAAIAMMLMSAGAAWLAVSIIGGGSTVATSTGPDATVDRRLPQVVAPTPGVSVAANEVPLITKYEMAIEDLEEALRIGEGNLEPETVVTLRHSLAVIDRAIDEARAALAADPGSAYLNSHLADTMRRKMDLLRYANYFATAQS